MLGSVISVTVTDADGHEATASTAAVIDEVALLEADQTGAKEVALTFNSDIDADDVITVNKGNKAVKIDSTTYGSASATITLADKIVGGAEYTVTLTPANGDDPTSVTFTGETATLGEIVFINDVLVMKDSKYSKGFAYVKGYDQYGDEINLSGLTVTPGVGVFESYDPSTGKITIDSGVDTENGETSPFLLMKEVPVFVQYQNGTDILSTQANLAISTRAYLSDMEFGEIKKDGTPRDDNRLTITELSSKKYYIEILDPKDQYGNALTADDLNDQKEENVLFVIPSDSGAFYQTGKFGTIKDKTILWLEDTGDSRPGTMALTITGAGGNTFTEDVTVEDDPFIQTLNVTYPMLYANVAASDELTFSAVDQYGNAIDLWDFVPAITINPQTLVENPQSITFKDRNNMTNRRTEITLSGKARFNDVKINAGKKEFTVTINTATDGAKKGDIISFVTTTAGMSVNTASVTVGNEGKAAKIKNTGSSAMLNANGRGGDDSYDFNSKLQFEDANGNTMKRDDADYPRYSAVAAIADPATGVAGPGSKLLLTAPQNYTPVSYYWTLADAKLTTAGLPSVATLTHGTANGKFSVNDMRGDDGVVSAVDDIYVILWAEDAGNVGVLLDQEAFHFTQVVGDEETYTAKCSDALYVKKTDNGYEDSVDVTVTAKTDKGESYAVDSSLIRISGIPFDTSGNTVYGWYDLDEVGTKTASVFVDRTAYGEGWKEVASVDINYTNVAPKPAKVSWGGKATKEGSRTVSKYGTKVSVAGPEEFDTTAATTVSIAGGVMSIASANAYTDNLEAKIVDQYGQTVPDTTFKANGKAISYGSTLLAGKNVIEYSAGDVVGRFTMNLAQDIVPTIPTATTVTTENSLKSALLGAADTIYVNGDIELGADLTIPDGKTVIIYSGKTLNSNGNEIKLGDADGDAAGARLTVYGTLKTNDNFTMGGNSTVYVGGVWDKTAGNVTGTLVNGEIIDTISGSGHVTFTGNNVANINFNVTGLTLVLDGVTFNGNAKLAGHVQMVGDVEVGASLVELQNGLDLDLMLANSIGGAFAIAKGAEFTVETTTGDTLTVTNNNTTAKDTGVSIAPNGTVTGGSSTAAGSKAGIIGANLSTLSGNLDEGIKTEVNLKATLEQTVSEDGKTVTNYYTVTGTMQPMGSSVNALLGYGDSAYDNYFAWRIVGSAMGTTNRYYARAASESAAMSALATKKEAGNTIDNPAVTTPHTDFIVAHPDEERFVVLSYDEDGVTYNHVYDLSAVTEPSV